VLSSTAGKAYLAASRSQQTGQANINGTKLGNMPIPLPPLAEQGRILSRVDDLIAICDALEPSLVRMQTRRTLGLKAVLATALDGGRVRASDSLVHAR
jgi:type I restriction enzyme S subunit